MGDTTMAQYISIEDQFLALKEALELATKAKAILAPVSNFAELSGVEDGFAALVDDVICNIEVAIKDAERQMEADDYEYEGGGYYRPFQGMIPRYVPGYSCIAR